MKFESLGIIFKQDKSSRRNLKHAYNNFKATNNKTKALSFIRISDAFKMEKKIFSKIGEWF